MAKIKGICRNEECELFNQPQEAEKSYFRCEKCGEPLIPFGNNTGGDPDKKKRIGIIVGGLVVIILIILAVVFGVRSCGSKKAATPADTTSVAKKDTTAKDTVAKKPEQTKAAEQQQSETQAQPAQQQNSVEKTTPATSKPQAEPKAVQSNSNYGTVNLGYGVYTGDLKNGKPHGHGTIRYTKSHKIVSSKDFVANPGDTYEGEFRDGSIASIGLWHHDGETTGVKP